MGVSVENKSVARHALKAFGGTPLVQAYHHGTESLAVDVLRCEGQPEKGVTSYSTLGLSDHPMFKDGREFPTRLELAGACNLDDRFFANVLASAAFCIIRTQRLYRPGSVMPGYLREYYPSTTVPHLYLTAPFLWEDALKTLDCGTKKVSWLMVVPISDRENDFLAKHGEDDFENLLDEHQVDLFDFARMSVV